VQRTSDWASARLAVWPVGAAPDRSLSDHFGVVAELDPDGRTWAAAQ
jgi:endonuclease/exonuclease/phosphatase family metal-dependent hydrolase